MNEREKLPMNDSGSTGKSTPQGPNQLVEHFFRHESANLVAVLTRAFGIGRIDLVEDMVQVAMIEAMNAWRQRGVPDNPAGWIHRVARNRILDALRREKTHHRALALAGQTEEASESLVDVWLSEDRLPDSLLRMMFVCCHPSLDRLSQIAMTLKVLCGFSVNEIARGLLMSPEATKKRIQRAKKTLADKNVSLEIPPGNELQDRLGAVHDVLYLMFNEGYSTSQGIEPIRDDVCEEAARLCHMLCETEGLSTPKTRALLSLMLFHASRLDARIDDDGAAVLLEDQDRSTWDHDLMRVAEHWFVRSKDDHPSRYHLEAAIAMQHCRSESVEATNWDGIVALYDRLLDLVDSPLYRLNRAIARGQSGSVRQAIDEIESIRDERSMKDYYLCDCAIGRLNEISGNRPEAIDAYLAALASDVAPHEEALIKKRLQRLTVDQ